MKRKVGETAAQFRKRLKLKRNRDLQNNLNYYWKNESAQATRQQKSLIGDLFAGAYGGLINSGHAPQADAMEVDIEMGNMLGEGELVAEAAAEAAAVDAILPMVIGAGVGVGVYEAGSAILSMFTQNSERLYSLMPGTYQGKFALSAKQAFKGLRDKYQKKGMVFIEELYGTVSDADVVYVGHSSFSLVAVVNCIGHALLRKLFRVACKVDVGTPYEELPLLNQTPDAGPNAYRIVYETRDSVGVRNQYIHEIDNDFTLDTILNSDQNGFRLSTNLSLAMSAPNPLILEKIYVYLKDTLTVGYATRLVYEMDLSKEVLSLAMSSHIVVQNRTKAAAGGDNTTNIDVQPLKGPVYEFSSGTPKIKHETPIKLTQNSTSGLILARASEFGGSDVNSWKEPPVKKAFQNVVRSGYTRLNPGALKSMTCGSDLRGYFGNVLFKLRINAEGSTIKRSYGRSQMVILEEELNSGSANLITVQYECQHIAGAEFTTTKSVNCQPGYSSANINNIPA